MPKLSISSDLGGFAGLSQVLSNIGADTFHFLSFFSLGPMRIIGHFLGGLLGIPVAQATVNYFFGAHN